MRRLFTVCFLLVAVSAFAQNGFEAKFKSLAAVNIDSGVRLTFDEPEMIAATKPTKVILFALPNGNTTAQTFGKILKNGDDWHFDIQHIGAQTAFLRNNDKNTNYIVVYLENNLKSWPAWRRKTNADNEIARIVDIIVAKYAVYHPKITLSGHSGGGSFIFGYLNSQEEIPNVIERIGFLDATYGYETDKHLLKLNTWLAKPDHSLQVIAYNDSVVVYNGKPLVSPTGGTWYRSKLMQKDLSAGFNLKNNELTDRLNYFERKHRIEFTLIKNSEAKIFHTVLVEKNGFIHLVFNGTKHRNKDYTFWGDRAYSPFVLE